MSANEARPSFTSMLSSALSSLLRATSAAWWGGFWVMEETKQQAGQARAPQGTRPLPFIAQVTLARPRGLVVSRAEAYNGAQETV